MSYILLTSAKNDINSTRAFNEFRSPEEVAKHLIEYFEDYLNTREAIKSDDSPTLEYKSDDLYKFLDEFFEELCCLVRQDGDSSLWIPYPKAWIKEQCIYIFVRSFRPTTLKSNALGNSMDIDEIC